MNNKEVIAVITYDGDAEIGKEIQVVLTDIAVGFLAELTDLELKVIAAETAIHVRRAFEMPPSPEPEKK